ncbi:MAG: transglycosylase domain-containing protein [Clostridia bacterium]|nr:transglycosylase domain-containing protein [Clostridia bacterium]
MHTKRKESRIAIFCLSCTLMLLIVLSLAVVVGAIWARTVPQSDLKEELFSIGVSDRTTRLYCYDQNGAEVELVSDRVSGYENALYCPISQMPENLKNAFIAIEDKRFYDHGGIDWIRTASAVRSYLAGENGSKFGGSTITQQLVKNLTGDSEKTLSRKVGELMRAVKVEQKLSKNAILEQYLNVVNLAENCYGVKTAANAYFSKEPSQLTLAECASIAAITNNPTKYDPIRHPENNRARRNLILNEMLLQEMISEREYHEAVACEVELSVNREAMSGRVNSWYADLAISDVIAALVKEKGYTQAEASRLVYCGGLKIYVAMNRELQEVVTEYYENTKNFPVHEGGEQAQSSIMIVDPANGDILAIAGATGKKNSNRIQNYATDTKRPSGSVIKPLAVYAPALERNLINYASVFDDVPQLFRANGAPWPRNSPDVYRGLTTVNAALTHSVNTVSVAILQRLGTQESYRFLRDKLGFTSLDREKDIGAAALALGQQHKGVTLREMLGGYTALANNGVYEGTRSYYKVLDSKGELLLTNERNERRVLGEDTASIMTMMLRRVVREGTGKAITLKERVDVAGKTGTSSNNCDKWFIGYTPELLCGVWYGYEYPKSVADISGNHALGIWDAVMQRAIDAVGISSPQFKTAEGIVTARYCKDSGLLMSDACYHDPRGDRAEIGYFKKGTEPHTACQCHTLIDYCDCGGIATENCPEEHCHKTALLRVSRNFPRQIKVLDAPYSYGGTYVEKERELSKNEPYYANKYETKQNFGIGLDVIPYNHVCPAHTEDAFWRRRAVI